MARGKQLARSRSGGPVCHVPRVCADVGEGTSELVPVELRIRFHRHLEEIDAEVVRMFAIVRERVAAATDSFVTGNAALAQGVTSRDVQVDRLEREVELLAERLLLTESPMCGDMRYLVTVLRVVPQLERCGDLAEHVAQRTVTGLGVRLTPRTGELLAQMGSQCDTMWAEAARAWVARDANAAEALDLLDDELDSLHAELSAEIPKGGMVVADAMQATLVGRFYERLGDHAVHIARRIAHLAPAYAD
jgi:phosphate transport system protein